MEALSIISDVSSDIKKKKKRKTGCIVLLIISDSTQCKLADASQWLLVTLEHCDQSTGLIFAASH